MAKNKGWRGEEEGQILTPFQTKIQLDLLKGGCMGGEGAEEAGTRRKLRGKRSKERAKERGDLRGWKG